MITITLVKLSDGTYRGLDYSSRWNLSVIKADFGLDVNTLGFKAYRDSVRALGFKTAPTRAGTHVRLTKTPLEMAATSGFTYEEQARLVESA